jgi:hypothetical protein
MPERQQTAFSRHMEPNQKGQTEAYENVKRGFRKRSKRREVQVINRND